MQGQTPDPLDPAGIAGLIDANGGVSSIWTAAQNRHTSTYNSFDIGALPWRLVISGGVPTIRRVRFFPATADDPLSAGITLAAGDGTVPLRSQTLLASDGGAIPGVFSDVDQAELCASEHGSQMSDPDLLPLIGDWLLSGKAIDPAVERACREQHRVVFDKVDATFATEASG